MVTVVDATTGLVLTVNVTLLAPAVIVTLEGTRATSVLLLESATCAPPAGAGPLNVTVPADEFPPATLVGFSVSEESVQEAGPPGATANATVPGARTYTPKTATVEEPQTAPTVT